MGFSSRLSGELPITFRPHRSSYHCYLPNVNQTRKFLVFTEDQKRRNFAPLVIRSELNKLRSDVSGDSEATEPAKALLERLFAKTQELEEITNKDSSPLENNELTINLEVLESDLQAALLVLRKKEADLHDAERRVLLENARLNHTKQNLENREREIADACAKQRQMEEELNEGNHDLASRSSRIEHLKLMVEEQGKKIARSQSSLSMKEAEMNQLGIELMKKNEDAAVMSSEVKSKEQLLSEANLVIEAHEAKVEELQRDISEKEYDLVKFIQLRKSEEESLKIVEANVKKQTMDWLSARKELKEMADQASKYTNGIEEASEQFERVRGLLADVRSELISTQESLVTSCKKTEDHVLQLEKQLAELDEQKILVISFRGCLKYARLETGTEKIKLRAARGRSKELESQLSEDKKLFEILQEDIERETSLWEQETQELALLEEELQQKELEYSHAWNFLQRKEYELVETTLHTQYMKFESVSIQLILQEKETNLSNAQKELADMNQDISELHRLLNSKEHELIQASTRMQEKEELGGAKLRFSEAKSIVNRAVRLTNKFVVCVKDEGDNTVDLPDEGSPVSEVELDTGPVKRKQLEAELEMMKGLLREKGVDLLSAKRALVVKDEELQASLRRWETREKERENRHEFLEDQKPCSLAQQRIGDRKVGTGSIDIEKLQPEAAELEAEAATSALHRLAEMAGQVFEGTNMREMSDGCSISSDRSEGLEEDVEREVTRLFALTELLAGEADIKND